MSEPGARQQEKQKQRREERQRQQAELQSRHAAELAKQQELTRQNAAAQQELLRGQQELNRQTNARGWALMAASIHTAGPAKDAVFDTAEKFAAWILKAQK